MYAYWSPYSTGSSGFTRFCFFMTKLQASSTSMKFEWSRRKS
jgi:hypothetical protein